MTPAQEQRSKQNQDQGLSLIRLLGQRPGWLLIGLALTLLSLAAGLALLALSGWFITASALAGLGLLIGLDIFTPGAGIRLAALTRTVSRYAERLVTHEATFRLLRDLRSRIFGQLLLQDEVQLRSLRRGDTLSRLTRDIDALDHVFLGVVAPSAAALLLTMGLGLLLALVDPQLALLTAGLVLIANPLFSGLVHRAGLRPGRAVAEQLPDLRSQVGDGLEGLDELRALDLTGYFSRRLDRVSGRLIRLQRRLADLDTLGQAMVMLTGLVAVWLGLVLALNLFVQGQISAAFAGLIILAVLGMNEAWLPLPAAWRRLGQCRGAAERVRSMTRCAPLLSSTEPALPWPDFTELTLEGLDYRYHPHHPAVLENFSLTIQRGETIALVGPSGSGKSTLGLLLMRQDDPDQGRVLIGDLDVRLLAQDELRRRIGYLPQDPVLFRDTLAANLRLASPDADDQALIKALEQVGLGGFLSALPDGLETWIDEAGSNVSGGQRRRIALARLMLTDPEIVILDEPLASLDRGSANELILTLKHWLTARTALVITHSEDLLPPTWRVIRLS